MRHRIEPLRDRAGKLRLPARQHFAHGADATGGVRLDPGDFGHTLFEFARVNIVARGLLAAHTRGAHQHDGDGGQQREHDAGKTGERFADRQGDATDNEKDFGHQAF